MGAVGLRKQRENTRLIEREGCDTTLNGQSIKGFWQNAGIIAIPRFIADTELAKSVYEVRLPAYAYDAPYSIKNGDEIVQEVLGWRCIVRNVLDPELNDNEVIQCNALCVGSTE